MERVGDILEPGGTEVSTAAGGARRYRKPLKTFRWAEIRALLSESLDAWNRHKAPRLGASLAFYTLLSLTPLLLVMVTIAGVAFDRRAAEGEIVQQVNDLVGPAGAKAIAALLESSRNTTHGWFATIIGLVTLLFGASGVLIELRDALNTIWEVPPRVTSGFATVKVFIRERLFSFALVLAIGFLLLVSLIVSAWIAALGTFSQSFVPAEETVMHIGNLLVSFIITTGLFAAIYKVMPEVRIEWTDVIFGGAVTSLLFNVGKLLIGLYLGKAAFASAYGAAASVVVFIVWVYYSGQVFFLGAEFTKVFANHYGSRPMEQTGIVVPSTARNNAASQRPPVTSKGT
ncbi:MAG TPA: YihY/virulence factor BrkB family protein [Bryobacteraceae bacterium]|nr:YihY/virulence factor BrkB family protein [Bryobacteraceae bacterium]